MGKHLLPVLIFLFISKHLFAQTDSLKYKYTNQTIYRYGGSFMKGTERVSFQSLQGEFTMSELGLAAYTKSKQYKTTSTIFRFLSLGSGLATLAIISENNLSNNRRNLAYGFLGGQIVFSFVAGRFGMLSTQSLDKALWQRNKDLLFPAR